LQVRHREEPLADSSLHRDDHKPWTVVQSQAAASKFSVSTQQSRCLTRYAIGDILDPFNKRLLVTMRAEFPIIKVENFAFTSGDAAPVHDRSRTSPTFGVVFRSQHVLAR